jgi:3-phosphoshikimate 1-carboxyvinyltransferase
MTLVCEPSTLCGSVEIPGSKSHTIRAVAIAALADGESEIREPLDSDDARSAVAVYRALGADIEVQPRAWRAKGVAGEPRTPHSVIDVGNSGTTLNVALGTCALLRSGMAVLTGDDQVRRRPSGPLAASLNDLGAVVRSTRDNGCPPFVVEGKLRGGETSIEAVSSQFLTSLLINAPLAEGDSHIRVPLLNERPYVEMTLDWLDRQGIRLERQGLGEFRIPGGQCYRGFERRIPGDFSSATFFLAAGALGDNDIVCVGLDMADTQGDRAVVDYLRRMGARVDVQPDRIRVRGGNLVGCEIDLNDTPDALPMLAVLGCFAKGTTRLMNVPQARIKETDRITVMKQELERLGGRVEELPEGLVVHERPLRGGDVDGQGDHRVIMALAIAGCATPGRTEIHGHEAVGVTFPTFLDCLSTLGGKVRLVD